MFSGLDYLTQQPAMQTATAPVQGAPTGERIPTQSELDQYRQSFLADQAQRMQNFGAYVQANPFIEMSGTAGRDERFRFQPNLDNRPLQLVMNGELLGTGTTDEERNALVERARALSAEGDKSRTVQLLRQTGSPVEQGGLGYFYTPVYDDAPDPAGLGGFLKTLAPIALSALSGGVLAGPLAGALGVGKTVATGLAAGLGSTAGNLAVGNPLGQSLTSGALSGLTAGALSGLGVGQPGGFLGGSQGSTLGQVGNLAADLGPDAINVIASKLPSSLASGIVSGAGGALSNLLPSEGGVGAPTSQPVPTDMPGLTVTGSAGASSAFPSIAGGLAGVGQTALDTAQQPQTAPTEEPEIDVLADSIPPSVLNTLPIPFPGVDLGGLAQSVPDFSAPQPEPTSDDEIVVTASPSDNILTSAVLPIAGAGALAGIGSSLGSVPPAPPAKTPLQKAATTAGRVLTGLSVLGALGGRGGGGGASALGPGAAALGTRASLDPVFGGQLPAPGGIFASQGMAPRDMGDIDYERYGYGPARSFFENVPETPEQYRAALAANAPRPMVSGAGMVGVPNILANFPRPAMGSAEVQAVRRLAPGVSDAQIEAFLATPEGADFLAAIQEAGTLQGAARGGAMSVKGTGKPSRDSYAVKGAGTGRSDEIPALLSDGEYVIDAETVAMLGDGSSKAGAKRLDDFRVKVRQHKGRNLAKGRFSDNAKRPENYLSGGRV